MSILKTLIGKEGETEDKTFNVAAVEIHKYWQPQTDENDIAILKLDGSVTRSSFRLSIEYLYVRSASISPICLPSPYEQFTKRKGYVIGRTSKSFSINSNEP